MLFYLFAKIILVIFAINAIKSEELLSNLDKTLSEATAKPALSSSTKKDLNFSALENLPLNLSPPENLAAEQNDFNSLNLENFATTPANLQETNSLSSTTSLIDLKDGDTTPSWELIYPEQNANSTTFTPAPALSSSSVPLRETLQTVLPKYFKVDDVTNCQKYFGQCLKQVLANVVPRLKDGHKSLNAPSWDPLYFNATAFQYNSGPFTGYITIRYALVYGLTSMKFKKIDFYKKEDKFKVRLIMLVPEMSVIGAYKGDLHVNNVRVRPRGDFNVSVTGLGVEMLSLGVLYKKDEHTFLKFTKANASTTVKNSKVNATGIFPDQRLNEIVVNVANQYWRELFNVVLPETRNSWLPILLDALSAALDMVPFDFFEIKS